VKDGIKSLFYNIDGNRKKVFPIVFYFFLIPLLLGCLSYYKRWILPIESIDFIISTLGIFTALIFGVIFIAPDKFSQRIEIYKDKKDDATNNYLIRYENFAKIFVEQIALLILYSIVIIILLFALLLFDKNEILMFVLNAGIFFLSLQFIMLLFVLLSNIYILLKDDIRFSKQRRVN
jgi:hypothetical protein